MTTTASALDLKFDEAIAYLRQKTAVTSEGWTDVFGAANARAFTVAGATTQALSDDFFEATKRAADSGTSLGDFRKDFDAIVRRHGWEHVGSPGWRSRIIFETNLGMAYSAGRFAQQAEPETLAAFPYWQYVHSGAVHFRPEHKSWDGLVLRADDPFWKTHYPPNGWGCGCWVRPVSARQLGRMGKSGPDTAPPVERYDWTNPRTGEVRPATRGIDVGFDYNPGEAWKGPVQMPANATLTPGRPIDPAVLPPVPPPAPAAPVRSSSSPPVTPDAIESFTRDVLDGRITDPKRTIVAAELPAHLAARLAARVGSNSVELDAFRVMKVAGRAEQAGGLPSAAHPEISPEIWRRLPEILDQGEAWEHQRQGWTNIEVVHQIEGRPYLVVLRRILRADGSTRVDIPAFYRIGDRRLATIRAGKGGRVRVMK